jgi:glycosyltransferase involved in cell wall biosynthesis
MTLGRVVDGLHRRGHEMSVITPRRADRRPCPSGTFSLHQVPSAPIPRYPDLRFGFPAKRRILRLWHERRPDLVHVATEGPLGWSAVRAAHQLGVPLVTSFHTNFHSYGQHYGYRFMTQGVFRWLRYIHRHAHRTFVPSEELRTHLQAEGFANLRILGRGVDTTLFTPERRDASLRASWGADEKTPVVIYVGRLAAEKNLPLTIRAWQTMRKTLPQLKLIMVGDGPLRAKLAQAHPEIIFAGTRKGADLARHYASGDIFLFASTTETFGNVVTEAMASGLGVLAFDYAAPRRFIRPGETGWLAPFGDEETYLSTAAKVARSTEAWPAIRRSAHYAVLPVSWEGVLGDFEKELLEITSSPIPASQP